MEDSCYNRGGGRGRGETYYISYRSFMRKTKTQKLTKIEERLLLFPPTKDTWICNNCDRYVSGSYNVCIWCRVKKPKQPKLVWPKYIKACEKINIEPLSAKYKVIQKVPHLLPRLTSTWITREEFDRERGINK
jgi:hypothetical protein